MTGERLIKFINYAYDKYGLENTMIIYVQIDLQIYTTKI